MWLRVGEEREPESGVGRKKGRRICIRRRVSNVTAACGGERKMMDMADTQRKRKKEEGCLIFGFFRIRAHQSFPENNKWVI